MNSTLTKELDALVRQVLWLREAGRCYYCGGPASDVAHLIGRRVTRLRFDTHAGGNCHLLCRRCHRLDHDGFLGQSYRAHFIEKQGMAAWDELKRRQQSTERVDAEWIIGEWARLQGELEHDL